MNILLDIGHTADVHLLRNLYFELKAKGHKVYVTVKELEIAIELLEFYQIPYFVIGIKSGSIFRKVLNQFLFNYRTWKIIRKYRIDTGIGTSVTLAQLSRITKMKSIILDDDDDEVQPLFVKSAHPYATYLLSPESLRDKRKRKDTLYYPAFHELAYLHPSHFRPDPGVLAKLGLAPDETFFIVRFNSFRAHHDTGEGGMSYRQKIKLIGELEKKGKVFISSESSLEPGFEGSKFNVPAEDFHSALYYASMYVGESQTICSEAAVLGVPSFRCNTFAGRISYLEEEEQKYGLTFGYSPERFEEMLEKIRELLSHENLKGEWQEKRQKLLRDKIDPVKFYLWIVENMDKISSTRFDEGFFRQFK